MQLACMLVLCRLLDQHCGSARPWQVPWSYAVQCVGHALLLGACGAVGHTPGSVCASPRFPGGLWQGELEPTKLLETLRRRLRACQRCQLRGIWRRCGGAHSATGAACASHYCSVACQAADWAAHRRLCCRVEGAHA